MKEKSYNITQAYIDELSKDRRKQYQECFIKLLKGRIGNNQLPVKRDK